MFYNFSKGKFIRYNKINVNIKYIYYIYIINSITDLTFVLDMSKYEHRECCKEQIQWVDFKLNFELILKLYVTNLKLLFLLRLGQKVTCSSTWRKNERPQRIKLWVFFSWINIKMLIYECSESFNIHSALSILYIKKSAQWWRN